jgi:hypothetical protein
MGVEIAEFPNLDRTRKEFNCGLAVEACKQLRVEPYVTAKELADPEVDCIAIMATLIQFKHVKPIKTVNEKAKVYLNDPNGVFLAGRPVITNIQFFYTIEYFSI